MTDKLTEIVVAQSNLSGVTRIGSLIWWDLATGLDITHSDLITRAKQYGVSDRFLPNEISPVSAFKRAANAVRSQIKSQDLLLREISNDPTKLVLGLVHEDKQTKKAELKYSQFSTITFHKDRSVINYDHINWSHQNKSDIVYDKICVEFKDALKLKTDDIRRILTSFAKACTISLRDAGGVYFVPLAYEQDLKTISDLISSLNSKNIVYVKPEYVASDADRKTLQQVGQNSLIDEIKGLEEDLDKLLADNNQRNSTLTQRLKRYRETREKVETISKQLQFQSDGLLDKLDQLTRRLKGDVSTSSAIPTKEVVVQETPTPSSKPVNARALQLLNALNSLDF